MWPTTCQEFLLAYVGFRFGTEVSASGWGLLMQEGPPYVRTDWWTSSFPGLTVALVSLGSAFLGDALVNVLDMELETSAFAKLV